jgi:hypothetical protein
MASLVGIDPKQPFSIVQKSKILVKKAALKKVPPGGASPVFEPSAGLGECRL